MMRFISTAACVLTLIGVAPAAAQQLSPEDIARMLDEQAATPNPYAELLNDPDPARSMGAMRIMMESGDPALVEMALEFGLLSSDGAVQRATLDQYFASEPLLLITFDGSSLDLGSREGQKFSDAMTMGQNFGAFGGIVDEDGIGVARVQVGPYNAANDCYLGVVVETCMVQLNAAGVFFQRNYANGRLEISDAGALIGKFVVSGVDDLVPVVVTILD